MTSIYIAAFVMGFFGSMHCIGMCGGITIAFNQGIKADKQLKLTFIYQFFRIVSYGLLGVISAALGFLFTKVQFPILPIISGLFMIFLGFYLLNFGAPLLALERIGHKFWQKLQPIQKKLLPMEKASQAMFIGLLWGFLPCGLVYSALALAITTATPLEGFITMISFGVGTLPMMLSLGLLSQKLITSLNKSFLKRLIGIIFICWGLFYLYSAFNNQHAHHSSSSNQDSHHEHHHH